MQKPWVLKKKLCKLLVRHAVPTKIIGTAAAVPAVPAATPLHSILQKGG